MRIIIETIPNENHRYETCGDWKFNEWGDLEIKVSEMGNDVYHFAVGIHEAFEAMRCKQLGIKEEDITNFDIKFEKKRKKGNTDEPGDDPASLYKRPHFQATNLERMVVDYMDEDFNKYNDTVNNL